MDGKVSAPNTRHPGITVGNSALYRIYPRLVWYLSYLVKSYHFTTRVIHYSDRIETIYKSHDAEKLTNLHSDKITLSTSPNKNLIFSFIPCTSMATGRPLISSSFETEAVPSNPALP